MSDNISYHGNEQQDHMPQSAPKVELRIDDYEIIERLKGGLSGTTYKVKHHSTQRVYILKFLPRELRDLDDEARKHFEREVNVLTRLGDEDHDNIVPIVACKIEDDICYFVREYKDGGSLRDLLNHNPKGLPIEQVIRLFTPLANALDFIHRHDIIHRDLKPENIVLQVSHYIETDNEESKYKPYLTDFDIAKVLDGNTRITRTVVGSGTPAYMAPEVFRPGVEITKQADIYALGIMLYEALEGNRPFDGTRDQISSIYLKGTPLPYPHEIQKRTNRQVVKVILKALHTNPDKRYESATQLLEQLQEAYNTGKQQDRVERLQKIAITITTIIGAITICSQIVSADYFPDLINSLAFKPTSISTPLRDDTITSDATNTETQPPTATLANLPTITESTSTITTFPTATVMPIDIGLTDSGFESALGIVNLNQVNIREGPSRSYSSIGYVNSETQLKVIARNRTEPYWYLVEYENNKFGWISSQFIDLIQINSTSIPTAVTIPAISVTQTQTHTVVPPPTATQLNPTPIPPTPVPPTRRPNTPIPPTPVPPTPVPPTQPPYCGCSPELIDKRMSGLSEEQRRDIIRQFDKNGDGGLSCDEIPWDGWCG